MTYEPWLDQLIEHEIAYLAMLATCERTPNAVYLVSPSLPEYHDGNRALRLRCAGSPPGTVADQVMRWFRDRGIPPTADVDPIAESEGIGDALVRAGLGPVEGAMLLMRHSAAADTTIPSITIADQPAERRQSDGFASTASMHVTAATIEMVPNETGAGEAADWIDTAASDDIGWPDEALWRAVAQHEARNIACRLYLARVDGRPAGTCDLFQHAGWGRIDSVVTHPEFRRRGIGSALVARGIADSLTSGNRETYLFTEPGGAAERLYRRLGFTIWHPAVFRQYRA